MSELVTFNSQVYDRKTVNEVVDRSFREFGQKTVMASKTVEQFFQDYEDLYFEIPAKGDVQSHQYLVEKSSELYKMEDTLTDIQPLLDEITALKNQSVQDQQTILELNNKIAEISATSNNV